MTLPSMLVVLATIIFLVLERMFPGRDLPKAKGWYWRALLVNFVQLGITLATARLWIRLFHLSVFHLSAWHMPLAEGFVGWFVGTFFFYWWHVLRHKNGFWLVFHQVHHSPSRIEIATSFYKHPIEVLSDAILSALVMYPLLGSSMMGAFWYNFFAATGEYFYHAKSANAQLAEICYPDTGIAFDTSPIQRSPIQLFGHPALGSPVWDL
jgi:sterol desaturase/sphingolipid hydroxylase (fatty acid hydroxylase superfamily)